MVPSYPLPAMPCMQRWVAGTENPVFSEFDIEFHLQRGLHVYVSQDTESSLSVLPLPGNRLIKGQIHCLIEIIAHNNLLRYLMFMRISLEAPLFRLFAQLLRLCPAHVRIRSRTQPYAFFICPSSPSGMPRLLSLGLSCVS